MACKNLEVNIIERIMVRLQGINGSGNYNFSIPREQIFQDFKLVTEVTRFPTLCLGSFTLSDSKDAPRDMFQPPFLQEVWGYVKDSTNHKPLTEVLKLLSDVRVAIGFDEFLNKQVSEFKFSADAGAIGDIGYLRFRVGGTFEFTLI